MESRARGRGDERGRRVASRRAHTSTMTSSRFFASTRPAPGAPDRGLEARVRALLRDVRRCHRRRRSSRDASPDGPDAPDDESRACAICLDAPRVPTTLGGCPPGAAHVFCLTCVERWSEMATVCPLCKRAFDAASYVDRDGISRRREIAPKTLARTPADDEDDDEAVALALALEETLCEVCGSGEDEATTLLCDGCDAARHIACCVPPLREVPSGDWFCPACAAASEEDEDEASASDEGDGREEGREGCLPARRGRAGESPSKPKDEPEGREQNGGTSAPNVTFEMFRFAR